MTSYLSVFPRNLVGPESPTIKHIIEKTVIGNFAPKTPLIAQQAGVTSIGSCFAAEIARILRLKGVHVLQVPMAETANSAFALDHHLAHYITGKPLPDGFSGDREIVGVAPDAFVESLKKSDLVILTFGLSLVWFDAQGRFTAEVPNFSLTKTPGTSLQKAPTDFQMRQTGVDENVAAIQNCIRSIRTLRPETPIVLTLSPVPLMGTRYNMPSVPANTVSKAVLRAAIDHVMQQNPLGVYYWPSYEIVTWFGNHVERSFGESGIEESMDTRHVRRKVINLIGDLFVDHYVAPASTAEERA